MTEQAFQIQAPENFNFSTPGDWPRWRKKFKRFLVVSGVSEKDEEVQIQMLMYLMGDQADDVFLTLKFKADADKKKIKKVLAAFEKHFIVRRNVIYERALFNSRVQEEGESAEEFITALYRLAETCEYKTLNDEMIRDRIVVGVRDKQLSETLQLDNALTTVGSHQAVRQQQRSLQCGTRSPKLEQVKTKTLKGRKNAKGNERSTDTKADDSDNCGRCGHVHWKGKTCPTLEAECRKCKKKGHYSFCCKSKLKNETQKEGDTVTAAADEALEDYKSSRNETAFMMSVNTEREQERKRRWREVIKIDNEEVEFKLDPGADVSILPADDYKKKMRKRPLKKPDLTLIAAGGSLMDCIGTFDCKLTCNGKTIDETIYICRGQKQPLLSLKACEDLGLVRRANVLEDGKMTKVNRKQELPELFKGIGNIKGDPCKIKLKDGAKPFAVHTPGKGLVAADTLSRQPLKAEEDGENEAVVAAHINAVSSCLPVTDERLSKIWKAQHNDSTLKRILEYAQNGWPDKKKLDGDYHDSLVEKDEKRRKRMKNNYDSHHGAREMDELLPGDTVWIIDLKTWGHVKKKADTPRSYMIETPRGVFRRNRFHLKKGYDIPLLEDIPVSYENEEHEDVPVEDPPLENDGLPRSRFGRLIKPPRYYTP